MADSMNPAWRNWHHLELARGLIRDDLAQIQNNLLNEMDRLGAQGAEIDNLQEIADQLLHVHIQLKRLLAV